MTPVDYCIAPGTCLVCERTVPVTIGGVCRCCDDVPEETERKVLVKLDYLHNLVAHRVLLGRLDIGDPA